MPVVSKPLRPLYLGIDWTYDQYGIADVNKMLVEDINDLSHGIPIYYAILKEDKAITVDERKDALKSNVTLLGAKQPVGKKGPLDFDAMNINSGAYYQHITSIYKDVTHIVGHLPKLAYAPFNFKSVLMKPESGEPKVVLVIHDLLKDDKGSTLEDEMEELLKGTSLVISLGKQMYLAVEKIISVMETKPTHKVYMPNPPVHLLQLERPGSPNERVQGSQNILLYGNDFVNIDYELAVKSSFLASDMVFLNATQKDHVSVVLNVVKDHQCKKDLKNNFDQLKKESEVKFKKLQLIEEEAPKKEKMSKILIKSNLCIHPTTTESTVLGMESLMAAYAGVPVLMSDGTGAAGVFDTLHLIDSIVQTSGDSETDAETWSGQMYNKLKNPKASLEEANRVRKALLLDETIPNSHLDVQAEMGGASCLKWNVNLPALWDKMLLATFNDFDIPTLRGVNNPQEYTQELLFYLLKQRVKVSKGLLNQYLPKSLMAIWKEFLKLLEAEDRKVVAISQGSLVISIFCPTESSKMSLQRDIGNEKFTLINTLVRLMNEIVAVGCIFKDEKAVKEISEKLALAFVKEHSGRFLRSGGLSIYMAATKSQKLQRSFGALLGYSLLITEVASYYQNVKAFDDEWVDRRLDIERFWEHTQHLIRQNVEKDESHYKHKTTIDESWPYDAECLARAGKTFLTTYTTKETMDELITTCAQDGNWNAEKYVVTVRKGNKITTYRRDFITQYYSRGLYITLSRIAFPHEQKVMETLEKEILAQDGGREFWNGLTEKGRYRLCGELRTMIGYNLKALVRERFNHEVEALRTLSTDEYILTDLEDMIVDAVFEAVQESGAEKESTIKKLLEDNTEMETKINSLYWAKVVPFINSHDGLINEKIVERGVFDLQNDHEKMIANINKKLDSRLREMLEEIDEEKVDQFLKILEQYVPGKATRLVGFFESQIQEYASMLDVEAMARTT